MVECGRTLRHVKGDVLSWSDGMLSILRSSKLIMTLLLASRYRGGVFGGKSGLAFLEPSPMLIP
jgi:hypothetical protein